MNTINFNLNKKSGKFKFLNATNGSVWYKRYTDDQLHTNFKEYKEARIPYSRNHDSAVVGIYGGPYSHDVSNIFPIFDRDPYDPASYDFLCTDEAILTTLETGTETFFRLGQTIEHQIVKHNIMPPKDYHKWAVICEHIIKHYNEGWANGFNLNMQYWEIWNEPDLDPDESTNKRTWGGTKKEFFDFYEVVSKHLKQKFPNLKIGGPALACEEDWADDFLREMKKRRVELDFFSWHIYCNEPEKLTQKAERIHDIMVKNGYGDSESILNEWNYIRGWSEDFIYSIKQITSMKGAAFLMACMTEAQHTFVDMLMYYDTRPSVFNGVFDFYTALPLKGYYPLKWYGMFYDMEYEVVADNKIDNIYTLCGCDKGGKVLSVVTYYAEDDNAGDKEITLNYNKTGEYEIYLLDNDNDGEKVCDTSELTFRLKRNSCLLIKEK